MLAICDRSVVRSSVIPSEKYCWSESLLRLLNGSTTMDSRGATSGCAIEVAAASAGVAEGPAVGQSHHALPAIASAAITAADVAMMAPRRRRIATRGMRDTSGAPMASGRNA